jgi:hypothetical protein
MTNKTKLPKTEKTTAEVAIAVHRDYGLEKIIKAAEVIRARPAREKALGLAASKSLFADGTCRPVLSGMLL